jgi:hypothetical protein
VLSYDLSRSRVSMLLLGSSWVLRSQVSRSSRDEALYHVAGDVLARCHNVYAADQHAVACFACSEDAVLAVAVVPW